MTTAPTNTSESSHGKRVLQSLRNLIPDRPTTFLESLRIAETQAARLLKLLDVTDYPVLDEVISELPRIRIEYVDNLPSFGLSFWNGQYWIIQLANDQSRTRQRFTLFHEYKHIIDHGYTARLYRGTDRHSPGNQAELVADFFAGCALVPRNGLKAAWSSGIQTVDALAKHFDVSEQAISVRLEQTNVRESIGRRFRHRISETPTSSYFHRHSQDTAEPASRAAA